MKKKSIRDFDDEDLLDELCRRDLDWDNYGGNVDIITDLQMEEMNELFSNLDFISRENILKELRNER